MTRRAIGLVDIARHITGCRLIPETRVQCAFDDVASTIHQALKEGAAINKSLSSLGNVIAALAERASNPAWGT